MKRPHIMVGFVNDVTTIEETRKFLVPKMVEDGNAIQMKLWGESFGQCLEEAFGSNSSLTRAHIAVWFDSLLVYSKHPLLNVFIKYPHCTIAEPCIPRQMNSIC
ncbi:hypothetical protein TNCT_322511 [Trichonephila clavata]|uniref:Uncharacterized protein n=1 Tax=Trichonephila clavata TaxID=2740835 RepID=A0A8X6J672_TRICU|nr:hypothetical protein TNCT_322511 [Trichonephila clavata]